MIAKIREKPWLLVVAGLAFLLGLSVIFAVIAITHPPVLLK